MSSEQQPPTSPPDLHDPRLGSPDAYPSVKPNPMRSLSEFAVADTPRSTGPEFSSADDYLECRPQPHEEAQAQAPAPTQDQDQAHQRGEGGVGQGVDELEEAKQNEIVEARGKMATYGEGEVEGAVEGAAAAARRRRDAGAGSGGAGAQQQGGGAGLHGRGRGEVTLEANEADLQR